MANPSASFNSDFIFRLAAETDILTCELENNMVPQMVFDEFSRLYKNLSLTRDRALLQHLQSSSTKFRCHLPASKWAFGVAASVMWYYDEIIVNDPVLQILNADGLAEDQKKIQLRSLLFWLQQLNESITGGFLLFLDHSKLVDPVTLQTECDIILGEKPIRDRFYDYTFIGKKQNPMSEGLVQLDVQYHGLVSELRTMGNYIPPHINQNELTSVWLDFMQRFERILPEEIAEMNKQDMLQSMEKGYREDIGVVLKTVADSLQINTPVLFYRDIDLAVAQQFQHLDSIPNKVTADTSVYNYMVPYVEGIPPERWFDIRNQSPVSFDDFRWYMYELVTKLMKEHSDPNEIKYRIEKDVQSKMRTLTTEMENAKNKWRFEGVTTPLFMLTGSIGFGLANYDLTHILSAVLSTGSIMQAANTWSAVEGEKNKTALNSVYFLWKYGHK